ncbi:PLD nuclease N-terminal domain-containing protein [Bacillus sp. JJ1533]|uniref:PLD nuclease N-terminal domain-containing protein n=1 Tax=Bacillus sp. JJ1533 TaxID=3122959 RepID=UPI002FFFC3DB
MTGFEDINWALIAPIFVIQLILMVTALIDLARSEQTNGPKLLWVFVIVLVSMLGPILYFVIGRKR